ncbi:hypothetical protein [Streptomyces alkaliterrae]|uniref:Secreted protein n=1 Tax=Streptomyces alkaliterrae TaxID=2213162 RepID=A0A5P0YTP6_9ACTN|nr:hypothetical protein [Streptomyces alkaliterrae]MBB1255740.1 hypothetical protein [Streptomyces alkaliterrae]MBB1261621.1 hypothetical protein [Streptomyces alkaliterrae]MQS03686.1 hypothetical protein [Streptomyces alkaliterrae]
MLIRGRGAGRVVVAVVAVLLVGGCAQAEEVRDRAVGCGKLAVATAKLIDELERTVRDPASGDPNEVLDGLDKEVDNVQRYSGDADLAKAGKKLADAAQDVRDAVDQGRAPDLAPLRDAGAELTKVCAKG